MKVPLVALALLAVTLSGCTGEEPTIDPSDPDVEAARVFDTDVPVDGKGQDAIDCGGRTHLRVEYTAGDDGAGDFSVKVFSESSRPKMDENGNPTNEYSGINVWPETESEGTFSGNETDVFEVDISGTEGTWLLEVHRTLEHDGSFLVELFCIS